MVANHQAVSFREGTKMKIHTETSGIIHHLHHRPNRKPNVSGSEIQKPKSGTRDPVSLGKNHLEGLGTQGLSDVLSSAEKNMLSQLFPPGNLSRGIKAYETNCKGGVRDTRLGGYVDIRK